MEKYIKLEDLEAYKLSRKLSSGVWPIYSKFSLNNKIILGDQLIRSVDSVAANIAEGYGRWHYLDRAKFYYNSRGSLFEAKHWLGLALERCLVDEHLYSDLMAIIDQVGRMLNQMISEVKGKGK